MSYRPKPKGRDETILEKLGNAFGGGRLNDDYVLEYMGSAEFEFGAVPEAAKTIQGAKRPMMGTHDFVHENGTRSTLDFLWRGEDGDPFEAWDAWVRSGMFTKEHPHELRYRLAGETPTWWRDDDDPPRTWETAIYWSLDDAVMWSFAGEGHIARLLGLGAAANA
jgi:hypothetical protein